MFERDANCSRRQIPRLGTVGEVEDFQVGSDVHPASAKVLFDAQSRAHRRLAGDAVLLPEDWLVLSSGRIQIAANYRRRGIPVAKRNRVPTTKPLKTHFQQR